MFATCWGKSYASIADSRRRARRQAARADPRIRAEIAALRAQHAADNARDRAELLRLVVDATAARRAGQRRL